MGTRNITRVISGGELKVCQYGQWDGYPTSTGFRVASFARRTPENEMVGRLEHVTLVTTKSGDGVMATGAPMSDEFNDIGREVRWQRVTSCDATVNTKQLVDRYGIDLVNRYFIASRDTGCDVLDIIFRETGDLVLWTTDYLVGNDGDWQIEAVWELDYDNRSMTGIWRGKRRMWTFDRLLGFSLDKLRNEMRGFEREG